MTNNHKFIISLFCVYVFNFHKSTLPTKNTSLVFWTANVSIISSYLNKKSVKTSCPKNAFTFI